MKKISVAMILILALSGCTSSNAGGRCVGVLDQKKPGVEYSLSVWNIFLGLIFSETIIVPVYVVGKALECPDKG